VVAWGSGTRSVASVALIANDICFAVMTVMFVGLGSAADYGNFGRWLLLVLTAICWVFQYAMMSIRKAEQWPAAMVFYSIAYIACVSLCCLITAQTDHSKGATLVFYGTVFPRLARYIPLVRKAREEDGKDGKIDQAEYDKIESLERNHFSSISTAHSNIEYLLTLVINLSVLLPLQDNPFGSNLALCLTNSCKFTLVKTNRKVRDVHLTNVSRLGCSRHLVVHLPTTQPSPKMPKGSNYATIR
jgi:hypothetical protein